MSRTDGKRQAQQHTPVILALGSKGSKVPGARASQPHTYSVSSRPERDPSQKIRWEKLERQLSGWNTGCSEGLGFHTSTHM